MVMMVMIGTVLLAFFHFAARLFQGLFEMFIDPSHLLNGSADISGKFPVSIIHHRFLPFTVFAGMFFVMIYPVLQQYLYLVGISHSLILQAGCS